MKSKLGVVLILTVLAANAFAEEVDPVAKARFAVREAQLVVGLIDKQTKEDLKFDMMCLRLGRFSAILKRIRGSKPLPPTAVTEKFAHYESFCGWGATELLPRGATHPEVVVRLRENLLIDAAGLQQYIDANTSDRFRDYP